MFVTPNFHFNGNCKDAIETYKKVFGAEVICLYENKDANPEDYKPEEGHSNYVYHAELMLGNTRVMMSDIINAPDHASGNSVSLVITYDSAEEVKFAYEKFADEAVIISPLQSTTYSSCFVSFIDKFGMRWELMTEQTER